MRILLWGTILSAFLHAQNLNLVQYKLSDKLSQYYERLIQHKLAEYFDSNEFLVDTRVYYDETLVPSQFKKIPNRLESQLEALPGLPTLPDEMRPINDPNQMWGDSLVASEYRKQAEVRFIDFNILVDSTFSMEEVEFVIEMVRMVADLDETRGDRITVQKKTFPKKRNVASTAALNEGGKSESIEPQSENINKQNLSSAGLRPFEWVLVALILLGFAFLIWVLSKLFNLQSGESNIKTLKALRKELSQEKTPPKELITTPAPQAPPPPPTNATAEYMQLRTFLVNQLIGSPAQSGRVLTAWIQSNEAEGLRRAAIVLNLVDPKVVTFLKNHLSEKYLIQIEISLFSLGDVDSEEELELLREFKKDFQTGQLAQQSDKRQGDLFNFVHQMTNNQIKHLINEENPGIKGLVLAQMKSRKAAEILRSLKDTERAQVMVQMGQIQNLTVKTYREVAQRLSQKAITISNMKYVAADGVETLISVMLGLPTTSQGGYLSEVAEQDLELASRIRQNFVLFEELPSVEPKQLLLLLDGFDKNSLALALMKTESDFVKKVLSVFPDRARDMVLSNMEGLLDKSLDDVEGARKDLLGHIHLELVKSGGLKS